jgi:hypothetical protein
MLLVARTFVSGPSSRGSGSLRECGDVERVSSVVRTEGEERNDAEREGKNSQLAQVIKFKRAPHRGDHTGISSFHLPSATKSPKVDRGGDGVSGSTRAAPRLREGATVVPALLSARGGEVRDRGVIERGLVELWSDDGIGGGRTSGGRGGGEREDHTWGGRESVVERVLLVQVPWS